MKILSVRSRNKKLTNKILDLGNIGEGENYTVDFNGKKYRGKIGKNGNVMCMPLYLVNSEKPTPVWIDALIIIE